MNGPGVPRAGPGLDSISVCIPVYNRADAIERALRSVEAQTRPALEVIAVDDGSRDDSSRVLERLVDEGRIAAAVRQPNGGVAAARNTAIQLARGDWIVPLDADDELDPQALERAAAAVARAPGADWCITDIVRIGEDGDQVYRSRAPAGPPSTWLESMLEGNFVERTLLLRRRKLLDLGGYDPAFRCYEDWELNLRMLRAGVTAAYAPGPMYRYIKTSGSITSDLPRLLRAHRQIYERHHRLLADTGNPLYRRIFARRLWALGRSYLDDVHDPRAAFECLLESLRYESAVGRILRSGAARLGRAVRRPRTPPPPRPSDGAEPH